MKRRTYKLISVLMAAVLLSGTSITAYAAKLKAGSVKGLPERLVVLDDDGNSVSESGEYFFVVEGMQEGEVYSKSIQIMNLREDASYDIYFNAQPIESSGEIDLENECICNIYLDDKQVYSGKVTGEGSPDIRDDPLHLGFYDPGDNRVMKVEITWNAADHGGLIDNGARMYDSSGMTVLREASGKKEIYGETIFKWIFYAEVKEQINSVGNSGTPVFSVAGFVQTGENIVLFTIGIVLIAAFILIVLTIGKRSRQKKKE